VVVDDCSWPFGGNHSHLLSHVCRAEIMGVRSSVASDVHGDRFPSRLHEKGDSDGLGRTSRARRTSPSSNLPRTRSGSEKRRRIDE
jgi:hypothetical protein